MSEPIEDLEEEELTEEESQETIFRASTLERFSNPEQLDNLLIIVETKAWLALLTLSALLVVILLWAIFGTLPVKVNGHGIVISSSGLFNIQTKIAGTVHSLLVKPGEVVEKGALIAEIYDPEDQLKLKAAEIKVNYLNNGLKSLKESIDLEAKAKKEALQTEIDAKKFNIKKIELEIATTKDTLEKKKELVKEGLISVNLVNETEGKLIQLYILQEATKAALQTLQSEMVKGYRTEEYKGREQDFLAAKEAYDLLASKLFNSKIYSPSKGKVLEILTKEGDIVAAGTPVVWMEDYTGESAEQIIYAYFPIERGKLIAVGNTMNIEPSTVDIQEYGYLVGTVKEVSLYATSKETISNIIHNKGLVDFLTEGASAVIQVIVEPKIDKSTPSGYLWTSSQGPPEKLTTGTVCKMQAVVGRISPLYYIIPIQSFKLD